MKGLRSQIFLALAQGIVPFLPYPPGGHYVGGPLIERGDALPTAWGRDKRQKPKVCIRLRLAGSNATRGQQCGEAPDEGGEESVKKTIYIPRRIYTGGQGELPTSLSKMFVPSDSWIALPGNFSPTQLEYDSPVYHSQLDGVPLCDSHLLGLHGWYWAQAAALAQAQRTMAEDQWMSDSVGVEVSHPSP